MLSTQLAIKLMDEMTSKGNGKRTRQYMSCVNGESCYANTTEAEKEAGKGVMPHNSLAESIWGNFTYAQERAGTIAEVSAGAEAMIRMNGDFDRDKLGVPVGSFHQLPWQLQESAIVLGKQKRNDVKKAAQDDKKSQRSSSSAENDAKAQKKKALQEKQSRERLELYKLYGTEHCWDTPDQVDKGLAQLSSDTAKLKAVKRQVFDNLLSMLNTSLTSYSSDLRHFRSRFGPLPCVSRLARLHSRPSKTALILGSIWQSS